MLTAIMILGGLGLLIAGGEGMVRGAVALARGLGISPLVVGLTVIAYGTSMPEMVVSLESTLSGHPDIALGNVIGSNISNILLVLGVTALIFPIAMDRELASRDGILMLMASLLLLLFCTGGWLSRTEALVLLALAIFHGAHSFYAARKAPSEELMQEFEEETDIHMPLWQSLLYIMGGLVLLVLGGQLLIDGAVDLARLAGLSEAVIGLTIIAIGTSLPELIASAVAAYRKHPDICLGNIVGSNMMNIMLILGVAPVITPIPVAEQFLRVDLWIMLAASLALVLLLVGRTTIGKREGVVLLLCFSAYLFYQYAVSVG